MEGIAPELPELRQLAGVDVDPQCGLADVVVGAGVEDLCGAEAQLCGVYAIRVLVQDEAEVAGGDPGFAVQREREEHEPIVLVSAVPGSEMRNRAQRGGSWNVGS